MYMWWTHTMELMATIPANPATAIRYENSGLRMNTTMSSISAAVPGTTMT